MSRCRKCGRAITLNSQIQACGYTASCPYKQSRSYSDDSTSYSNPGSVDTDWSVGSSAPSESYSGGGGSSGGGGASGSWDSGSSSSDSGSSGGGSD